MIDKEILHYHIIEKLGEGGMGVVYKAQDLKLDRFVALKFLPQSRSANEEEKKRFIQEAKAASALDHPNICAIHEINETSDGQMFIVMAYYEGETLQQKVARGGLPVTEAIGIAIQISQGLAKAHEHNIVHRDLKPANVIITKDGVAKILDFGLAKLAGQPRLTKTGSPVGTMAYMSPEQVRSEEADHRADLWALGVALYEMLTGQLPFKGEFEHAVMYSILDTEPQSASLLCPEVPDILDQIIATTLAKKRDERYSSCNYLLNDLRAIQSQTGSRRSPVATKARLPLHSSLKQTSAKKKTNHTRFMFLGGIIVSVVVFALYFIFLSGSQPDSTLPPMRTVRITSFPGQEYHPALSPDGKSIAFSRNGPQQDNFDIYVKLVDVGTPVRVTTNPLKENRPEWSPDGRYIAFVRETGVPKESPKNELCIIPALGGRERKIAEYYPPKPEEPRISWSSDGKSVFFTDFSNEMQAFALFRVSVETSEREQVIESPVPGSSGDVNPAASPDGRGLAFIRRAGFEALNILTFRDKAIRQLTFDQMSFEGLAWTQDSRSIIFSANRDGVLSLWKISASGGTPEKIASGMSAGDPSISYSGNRLAYTEATNNSNIWKIDLRDTKKQTLLIGSSTLTNYRPDISMDERNIVFSSNRTGDYEIWVSDSDGKNQTQLTTLNSSAASLRARWSPDGQFIVFDLDGSKQAAIYTMQASGGKHRRIEDGFEPSWSGDGKWIYFFSDGQIHKVSRDGGTSIQLTRQGCALPLASHYSEFVYYIKDWSKPDIWRVPSAGGDEQPILEGVTEIDLFSWTVAQNGIYFIDRNAKSPVLEFFDFNTKQIKRLMSLPGALYWGGLALSPDETWLLYSKTESVQSDIILIENFR